MRKAEILLHDRPVGLLEELDRGYRFTYSAAYLKDPKQLSFQGSFQAGERVCCLRSEFR